MTITLRWILDKYVVKLGAAWKWFRIVCNGRFW